MDAIDNVPHLNSWWRANGTDIEALAEPDRQALQAHCAARKETILRALAAQRDATLARRETAAA